MIRYNYSRRNKHTKEAVTERDPMRYVRLQNPNTYRGELGRKRDLLWHGTDQVYNVNGVIYKADGNFLKKFFYEKIGTLPITLGSFPSTDQDVIELRQHGITAVLCLMDRKDF